MFIIRKRRRARRCNFDTVIQLFLFIGVIFVYLRSNRHFYIHSFCFCFCLHFQFFTRKKREKKKKHTIHRAQLYAQCKLGDCISCHMRCSVGRGDDGTAHTKCFSNTKNGTRAHSVHPDEWRLKCVRSFSDGFGFTYTHYCRSFLYVGRIEYTNTHDTDSQHACNGEHHQVDRASERTSVHPHGLHCASWIQLIDTRRFVLASVRFVLVQIARTRIWNMNDIRRSSLTECANDD